jgi:hypothetical protein
MIIRNEQFQVFEREAARSFIRDIARIIRENDADEWVFLPDGEDWIQVKDLPFETLVQLVEGGIARATGYGLEDEGDLIAFVSFMFSFAPNFDSHPVIQDVLTDEDLSDDERMDQVVEVATDQDWAEVEDEYDESAWTYSALAHA